MPEKKNKIFWTTKATASERISFLAVFAVICAIFAAAYLVTAGCIGPAGSGGCAFERNYSIPCPTCGMTRAVSAFFNGQIARAFYLQPAGAAFCVLGAVTAFFSLLSAAAGVNFSFLPPVRFWQIQKIAAAAAGILIAGWAVTLARALAKLQ